MAGDERQASMSRHDARLLRRHGGALPLDIPAIGRHPLSKLEPPHDQRMLADLTARGSLSPTTVRYVRTVLRIALGHALRQRLFHVNVASLVDAPAGKRHEIQPLTAEQARAFLDSVSGDPMAALYVVALATGCRQGELLGLSWADVDMEAGTLTVRHTLTRRTHELGEPKTQRGRRTLRLPSTALVALRAHRVAPS